MNQVWFLPLKRKILPWNGSENPPCEHWGNVLSIEKRHSFDIISYEIHQGYGIWYFPLSAESCKSLQEIYCSYPLCTDGFLHPCVCAHFHVSDMFLSVYIDVNGLANFFYLQLIIIRCYDLQCNIQFVADHITELYWKNKWICWVTYSVMNSAVLQVQWRTLLLSSHMSISVLGVIHSICSVLGELSPRYVHLVISALNFHRWRRKMLVLSFT